LCERVPARIGHRLALPSIHDIGWNQPARSALPGRRPADRARSARGARAGSRACSRPLATLRCAQAHRSHDPASSSPSPPSGHIPTEVAWLRSSIGRLAAEDPHTEKPISLVREAHDISYLVDSSIGVYSWISYTISRCGGSINRSERRDRSMKKLSEYVLGRLMSGPWWWRRFSGSVAAVERHEIVDGRAEAGRALTAEVASGGSGAVAGGGVVIRS